MTFPETTEHVTLPLDDGDVHVCLDGPSDAPTLLLIHGSASSTNSWGPLTEILAKSHRVIRIDLLGHGRSAKPENRSYELADQARRVGEAMRLLGVAHAIVVGHSSGGACATALAESRPDLVAALVLINSGPHLEALTAPPVPIAPEQWPHMTDDHVRLAMVSAFSRPGYEAPQVLVDDVRRMTYHSFAMSMRGARGYLARQGLPDRLKAVGKPLLVIFGEDDRRWRSSSAADYLGAGARVEMLPGLGHSPMLEDPDRTAAPLLAFTALQKRPSAT
ncbi:alpha/beta fold hydrolase [Phytomonospora sp. NPDC050363]|uniref:alpha/beta fold hydrolase n=1 Tax=Phytomonospora sp. NPDC050363 TaxID=3155642 RepID=UPI0033D9C2BA